MNTPQDSQDKQIASREANPQGFLSQKEYEEYVSFMEQEANQIDKERSDPDNEKPRFVAPAKAFNNFSDIKREKSRDYDRQDGDNY